MVTSSTAKTSGANENLTDEMKALLEAAAEVARTAAVEAINANTAETEMRLRAAVSEQIESGFAKQTISVVRNEKIDALNKKLQTGVMLTFLTTTLLSCGVAVRNEIRSRRSGQSARSAS